MSFEGQIESLRTLCQWDEITRIVANRFEVQIDSDRLRKSAEKVHGGWSDGTWLMFFKNRLSEWGLFPHGSKSENNIVFHCEMRVGFIHIEESPLMLARLRNDRELIEEHTARSRLNKMTAEFIEPINATAAKVV